jgi:archaellum biogenesis ATPase FlaH
MGSITQDFRRAPLPPDASEVRKDHTGIEREIFFGAVASYNFYKLVRNNVCPYDAEKRTCRPDFSIERYNIAWAFIVAYWQRFENITLQRDLSIPTETLCAFVIDCANRSGLVVDVAKQITDEIVEEVGYTANLTYESLKALAESSAFNEWLESRLLSQVTGTIAAQKNLGYLTMDTLEEAVAKARRAITPVKNDYFVNGANFLFGKRKIRPSVPITAFPNLSRALGGGLFWGEATMVAGINAGGKTIVTMQLARDFAYQSINTVVFTTERKPEELFVRSVSELLNVDIGRLMTVPATVNQEVEINYIPDWVWSHPGDAARLERMYDVYSQHLLFIDWSKGQGATISESFEQVMQQIEQTGWMPQIVIFDWIGGGLDVIENKDWLRMYYQSAADCLINHSKRTNRHVIMTAQLNKEKVKPSTNFVDMSMLSECLTMTNNLTNFIGITAKRDQNLKPGAATVQKFQNLCAAKATHGPGGIIPVEAQFNVQRFMERNDAAEKMLKTGGG